MMDIPTLGAALSLAKKTVLPATTAGDAGAVLAVDADGKWAKAQATTAAISVSGTTLNITGGE